MEEFIPTFTDITKWNQKIYSGTGGTRAKNIYVNPLNEKEYFFKGSKELDDGTFKYPSEFWSEIISSKIGSWLKFELLDYNIAFDKNDEQQIGCLSKSMVEHTENKLSEGVEFLRGFDPTYLPEKDEYRYTFNFIRETLNDFGLNEFEPRIIEMLMFDAIIGNSDRHQENWGFITKFKETIEEFNTNIKSSTNILKKWGIMLKRYFAKAARDLVHKENPKQKINKSLLRTQSTLIKNSFSPIYDSGCCLGRELEKDRILKMLKDPKMMESYVLRGRAEIRWHEGKKKPKHFHLMMELKKEFPSLFEEILKRIEENFSEEKLEYLIENIDSNIPEGLEHFKLSDYRKNLISKLIPLRLDKLRAL
ncbi:hypothetical protein C8P64_1956 [Christiangramia gaetbulicola]|uniref:HipA-like C-terminal domain-containing protein n=1 Tax=Christiangramia gaetbulicola TaxID=703340 RepID=A0A2T6AHY9_9FLAO|nr:hypothetical protein [Christiangramia gaetbulicola]PTX43429.1 hypothetical protein C8P64_1956 [Christiangramia gaetbulicola]